MRENVGRTDRTVRSIVGPGLIAMGLGQLIRGKWRGLGTVVAGALVVESAVTRVCPLNATLGLDTRSTQERMRDFRGDITEQTERIASDYAEPIGIDEMPPADLGRTTVG